MAGPITWQNVNGPSLAEASRPLEAAQRGFNASFDQLGGLLKERQAIQASNDVAIRNNNTNEFLNQLAVLGSSPNALKSAMENGDIDKLRAQFGGNLDDNRIRGAAESLLDSRFKQTRTANEFGEYAKIQANKPMIDSVNESIAVGDYALAEDLIKENPLMPMRAELTNSLRAAQRAQVERGQKDQVHGFAVEDQLLQKQRQAADIENMRALRAQGAAGLDLQRQNLELSRDTKKQNDDLRVFSELQDLRKEMGALGEAKANSTAGAKLIQERLATVKDAETRKNMQKAASEIAGIEGITTSVALTALMGIGESNWHTRDKSLRDDAISAAKELMKSANVAQQQASESQRADKIRANELLLTRRIMKVPPPAAPQVRDDRD